MSQDEATYSDDEYVEDANYNPANDSRDGGEGPMDSQPGDQKSQPQNEHPAEETGVAEDG